MSNSQLRDQIKEIVWQLIEKHYSVDRKQPQVLIAKEILIGANPIDEIGEQLAAIVEKAMTTPNPKPEDEEDEDCSDGSDMDPWGYYPGGGD